MDTLIILFLAALALSLYGLLRSGKLPIDAAYWAVVMVVDLVAFTVLVVIWPYVPMLSSTETIASNVFEVVAAVLVVCAVAALKGSDARHDSGHGSAH